jgi:mono/diheme cytochrome c family protein
MGITLRIAAACAITCAAALAPAPAAAQADVSRGRALYELRCQGCHSESVHARVKRTAKDFADVRSWVERWNTSLSLRWDAQEVDDVALHLNRTYYRYPCPPAVCRVVSLAPAVVSPPGTRR